MNVKRALATCALLLATAGCSEFTTEYYCTYERRSTGCGGSPWGAWTSECYSFDIEEYQEGWTPEMVCDIYTGSDTHCQSTCCINVEYRSTELHSGQCP